MRTHSPSCLQPEGRAVLVYPPAWYLNLVQLRCRLREETGRGPAWEINSVWNSDPVLADSNEADAAQLMALALEIVRLSHLDELPYGHRAHILGLDVLEVREYLREMFKELDIQAAAGTLIVEDEAAVALDLARIVRKTGHRVCGTAGHLKQAIALADRTHPILVLADVQLKDGPEAGIAAVQEIRRSGEAAAVYVTAYPERVRQAVSASLIVPKPFMPHDIQTAIWRALLRRGDGTSAAAA